jgi:hypothetical protein
MNRIERTKQAVVLRLVLTLAAAATMGAALPQPAAGETDSLQQWQLRRLNDPTPRELTHERKGNVYVYDGLADGDVEQAMNRHFDRIEYMMFVGTRKSATAETPADDNIETESPGCGD